ncbi:ATP-binding protein [bacterium]|nr:ATP-binding protein [bacterium]
MDRIIQKKIEKELFKGKVIIVYGARQVGKTTLVKKILKERGEERNYFDCEFLSVQEALSQLEPKRIKDFLGNSKLVVLDEAQKIKDIGLVLKLLIDTYPEMQVIATGSSSFDLASKVSEPLTGRKVVFNLFPVSLQEVKDSEGLLEVNSSLEKILRCGLYPEVFFSHNEESINKLEEIASSYLFKDVLGLEGIKKSSIIVKLLQLLALQVGNEVSYNEIANKLDINRLTVEKYIDILEKCFVVFRLNSFSRNIRNEISKSIKVYFYDLGIRNAVIKNFNSLDTRNDVGALWENFCIVERMKHNHYNGIYCNTYFWRTYDKKEIDYIEESGGKLFAYEFKYSQEKIKQPKVFLESYENSEFTVVTKNNYQDFLIIPE